MKISRKSLGVCTCMGAALIFGAWPVATRAVYADGGNMSFMAIASSFARALALCLFCLLARKPLFRTRRDIRDAATGGFFQAVSIITVFAALLYMPGPVVIIILYTHTLMLLFYLAWRRKIKLNAPIIVTTLVALLALSFVVDIWHPHEVSVPGLCLALISALATVSRLFLYGELTKTRDPSIVGAEAFLFTALFTLPLLLYSAPQLPVTHEGVAWAFLGCSLLAIGTFGMFHGIALIGAFQYSLLAKVEPMFTALFSALLINEVLHFSQYGGMVILMGSLAFYQYYTGKRQRTEVSPLAMVK